jgi:hypothetical protein
VAQIRGGDRLALKTLGKLRVDRQLRQEHLDRDSSLELHILGTVNPRHSAAPNLLLNFVAAKLLADQ